MTTREKLEKRLRDAKIIRDTDRVDRIWRGPIQKDAGAWAWEAVTECGRPRGIGSEDTMTACVRTKVLSTYKIPHSHDTAVVAEVGAFRCTVCKALLPVEKIGSQQEGEAVCARCADTA